MHVIRHALDWYAGPLAGEGDAATVARRACDIVAAEVGGTAAVAPIEVAWGHGYSAGVAVSVSGGEHVLRIAWGATQRPHAVTSGDSAQCVAAILQAAALVQRVTRVDSAVTWTGAPTWDDCRSTLEGVDVLRPLRAAGAWSRPEEGGRTLYVGQAGAAVLVRVYEKGREPAQVLARRERLPAYPEDAVRAEVQVRPGELGRTADDRRAVAQRAAAWGPGDAWEVSRRARAVRDVLALPVGGEPITRGATGATPADRAVAVMLTQYRRALQTLARQRGDEHVLDAVARVLGPAASAIVRIGAAAAAGSDGPQ